MTTEIGRVTSVVPEPAEKRVYVSVKVSPSEYYEEIPFATGMTGLWMVPTEGDIVEVYEVGYETYLARTPHNPFPYTQPTLDEGDFCLRLNEDTELFFKKQGDNTFNLNIETDGDITVQTQNGDVTAKAPNGEIDAFSPNVYLGTEGGNFKAVARKGDSVQTSDPLTGTETGPIIEGSSDTNST